MSTVIQFLQLIYMDFDSTSQQSGREFNWYWKSTITNPTIEIGHCLQQSQTKHLLSLKSIIVAQLAKYQESSNCQLSVDECSHFSFQVVYAWTN